MSLISRINKLLHHIKTLPLGRVGWGFLPFLLTSCANMGSPDGGWYDERPPKVIGANPADRAVNVDKKKIRIDFSEFIKLDNADEKVVYSPPQIEAPEIKAHGKSVKIELKDSLKPNTTYTIDFSDAISDNNEGNPLGNYTYSFSTGDHIDTMEVSGYVLNAEDMEPVKGILVGLYAPGDTMMRRVSRTDSKGQFVIRGVAPGRYTCGAVKDADGDYRFSQRGETMAFSHDTITPSCFPDNRQDTIWRDQLHVQDIKVVPYTHFIPDNIVLRAFDHKVTDRYFLKSERKDPRSFTLFYTAPLDTPEVCTLPKVRLLAPPCPPQGEGKELQSDSSEILSYNSSDTLANNSSDILANNSSDILSYNSSDILANNSSDILAYNTTDNSNILPSPRGGQGGAFFIIEPSLHGDTITYWLRDTALVNQDTLQVEVQTLITDTLGNLQPQTDTLEILAKTPYAKRMKNKQEDLDKWKKQVEKQKKRYEKELAMRRKEGLTEDDPDFYKNLPQLDTIPPKEYLKPKYTVDQNMDPDGTIYISFSTPMQRICQDSVHLYVEQDSVWYKAPFTFEPVDSIKRTWRVFTDWIPEAEYSFEIDTLAFEDIYGRTSKPYKTGLKVQPLTSYASLFVNISGVPTDTCNVIVQLIDGSAKEVRSVVAQKGTAEMYYINPGTYYLRAIIDSNNNGQWDTGDYYADRQPEQVFYDPEPVDCKAKWDLTRDWNLTALPLYKQKPDKLLKQKAEKGKTIQHRNADRALQKGLTNFDIPKKFTTNE